MTNQKSKKADTSGVAPLDETVANPPGRPATIRGRATVVSLILTPDACAKLAAAAVDAKTSEGDVFEAIVIKYASKVKVPAPVADGSWKPKAFGGRVQRYQGRNTRVNVRMSPSAIATIDAIADVKQAVRSDVAEALILQFVDKHTKGKQR